MEQRETFAKRAGGAWAEKRTEDGGKKMEEGRRRKKDGGKRMEEGGRRRRRRKDRGRRMEDSRQELRTKFRAATESSGLAGFGLASAVEGRWRMEGGGWRREEGRWRNQRRGRKSEDGR
ncbi:MAG: hypothetical protein NTX53_09165 [candidate division WOR-3 bacterium]|nr:hypothetical protein [candidate division WOR-3 bacterium]